MPPTIKDLLSEANQLLGEAEDQYRAAIHASSSEMLGVWGAISKLCGLATQWLNEVFDAAVLSQSQVQVARELCAKLRSLKTLSHDGIIARRQAAR